MAHGLASLWVDQTHSLWNLQRLALGECLGQGLMRTVGIAAGNTSVRSLYIMGDSTLRPFVVAPPTSLTCPTNGAVNLTWTASPEPGAPYHVYRSSSSTISGFSEFTRLTTSPLSTNAVTDPSPPSGVCTYMVRALCITGTGSGTYTNISQGAIIVRCGAPTALIL